MAINIENATMGYDANNLTQTINNIRTNVIEDTRELINNGLVELRNAVDETWKGKSAEAFKSKMESDADLVRTGIKAAGDKLEESLKSFISSLAEVDNSIQF